jgi:beta-glucosidase
MRKPVRTVFALAVATAVLTVAPSSGPRPADAALPHPHDATCPWMGPDALTMDPSVRATALADAMSTDQQVAFLNLGSAPGAENVTTPVPALCLPSFVFQDGPNGLALLGGEALPAQIALGATFDPTAATAYGTALGTAAVQRGITAVQGPTLNLGVWPGWGRIGETYGEDQMLTGILGTAEVKGIEATSTGVILKHFGIYTRELQRAAAQLDTTNRAIDEVFLSPFATVVGATNPLGMMCAFGHDNGTLQCADGSLMRKLAGMGFTGFTRTDLAATTDPLASLASGVSMFKTSLAQAMSDELLSGKLDPALLEARVIQVLTALFAHGYMDHPPVNSGLQTWTTAEKNAATRVGNESIVLLKNDGVLPIAPRSHLTVIGGAATITEALTVGGSSAVPIHQPANFLTPIVQRFGAKNVTYVQATPTSPITRFTVPTVTTGPATYTTTFTAPTTGNYVVQLNATNGTTSGVATIDGHVVGSVFLANTSGYSQSIRATALTAGVHTVTVRYSSTATPPTMTIQNVDAALAQAAAAAASAAVPIVFIADAEGEQADRSTLNANGYQNLLVQTVAAANPRTVVVIEAGGPVLMPWISKVAGVVDVWYPGQVAGAPLANVLSGAVNPSGHLPVTFPATDASSPLGDPAFKMNGVVERLFGPGGTGLSWGMHYYAAKGVPVAFPFGFGLSYTTFALSNLTITKSPTGWTVSVTVANTGKVAGRAVPQAYVTYPTDAGEPANQLKAIGQVTLTPGSKATVTMELPRSSLTIMPNGRVTVPVGTYQLSVGQASSDLALSQTFSVR